MHTNSGKVAEADIDGDGDMDLFVGGSVVPGRYPENPKSYILLNDGKGQFVDVTQKIAPELENAGMITDAHWVDVNNDNTKDLVVVGKWMPVTFFINRSGVLSDETDSFLQVDYRGLWNSVDIGDFNEDGKPDFIVGNLGTNSQINASREEPAELYYADFDQNGSVDPVLNFYIQGKAYPYITRNELLGQLAYLRSKFTSYDSYADASLNDIFTEEELEKANKLSVNHLPTTLLLSTENGSYREVRLPEQAQYSCVNSSISDDFDRDGHQDLLLLGNNQFFKLRLGKFDANYGTLLLGNGDGTFRYTPQSESGLKVTGDVKSAVRIDNRLLLGITGKEIKAYQLND